MKAGSIALAALALLLSLLLSAWLNRAQAEGRPEPAPTTVSSKSSTSQAFRDLQADKRNPFQKVDTSFGRIPPSTPNPTQNKCKPPLGGRRNHKPANSESLQH